MAPVGTSWRSHLAAPCRTLTGPERPASTARPTEHGGVAGRGGVGRARRPGGRAERDQCCVEGGGGTDLGGEPLAQELLHRDADLARAGREGLSDDHGAGNRRRARFLHSTRHGAPGLLPPATARGDRDDPAGGGGSAPPFSGTASDPLGGRSRWRVRRRGGRNRLIFVSLEPGYRPPRGRAPAPACAIRNGRGDLSGGCIWTGSRLWGNGRGPAGRRGFARPRDGARLKRH